MISNPRKGQLVRAWYRKSMAHRMPLHGKIGVVVVPGKGRPQNHEVWFHEGVFIVPAGNLVQAKAP